MNNNFVILLIIILIVIYLNKLSVKEGFSDCTQIDTLPQKLLCGQRVYSSGCIKDLNESKCKERDGIYQDCNGGFRCIDYLKTLEKSECIDTIRN